MNGTTKTMHGAMIAACEAALPIFKEIAERVNAAFGGLEDAGYIRRYEPPKKIKAHNRRRSRRELRDIRAARRRKNYGIWPGDFQRVKPR